MTQRRGGVTGVRLGNPIGTSGEEAWSTLVSGGSGVGPITLFDASDHGVRFACEVKELDVASVVDMKAARRMDRCTPLVLAAARQAEEDAGLDLRAIGDRVGSAIGTALGGVASFEHSGLQGQSRGAG